MSAPSSNLKLWSQVCQTAPSFTKHVSQRGGFTAIDPTWQSQRATEVFGMYGVGWGLREVEFDYSLHEKTGMVVMKAMFFFKYEDKTGEFPIHNAIKTQSGSKPDEDFAKKLETNTISKALSRLGFSADVFLGLFDDVGYVETAKTREAIQSADSQEDALLNEQQKFFDWCEQEIRAYSMIPNQATLKLVHQGHINKIQRQCAAIGLDPAKFIERFKKEVQSRVEDIKASKTEKQGETA